MRSPRLRHNKVIAATVDRADFARPDRPGSTRAYRSRSCSRHGALAAPGSSECHTPPRADAWQTSVAENDRWPGGKCPQHGPHLSQRVAGQTRAGDVAVVRLSPDPHRAGSRERPTAKPTHSPRWDTSLAAHREARPARAPQVRLMLSLHPLQVRQQRSLYRGRQHRDAILASLPVSNRQLAISHTGPRNRESSADTSERESTTGSRTGR